MKIGDLVTWDDPGKDVMGIVLSTIPAFNATTRVEVSWFLNGGVRISRPKLMEIKLVEPRKVNDSR
jgi:hypothetical protein